MLSCLIFSHYDEETENKTILDHNYRGTRLFFFFFLDFPRMHHTSIYVPPTYLSLLPPSVVDSPHGSDLPGKGKAIIFRACLAYFTIRTTKWKRNIFVEMSSAGRKPQQVGGDMVLCVLCSVVFYKQIWD